MAPRSNQPSIAPARPPQAGGILTVGEPRDGAAARSNEPQTAPPAARGAVSAARGAVSAARGAVSAARAWCYHPAERRPPLPELGPLVRVVRGTEDVADRLSQVADRDYGNALDLGRHTVA